MTLFFGVPKDDYTHLPPQRCPYCNYYFDCATGLDPGTKPTEGCISLCLRCMEVGVYNKFLLVRKATPEELEEIMKSAAWERIVKAQNIARTLTRRWG